MPCTLLFVVSRYTYITSYFTSTQFSMVYVFFQNNLNKKYISRMRNGSPINVMNSCVIFEERLQYANLSGKIKIIYAVRSLDTSKNIWTLTIFKNDYYWLLELCTSNISTLSLCVSISSSFIFSFHFLFLLLFLPVFLLLLLPISLKEKLLRLPFSFALFVCQPLIFNDTLFDSISLTALFLG